MGPIGWLEDDPIWHPNPKGSGEKIQVSITYSKTLWPYAGWLALHIIVPDSATDFAGVAEGVVSFTVVSPAPLVRSSAGDGAGAGGSRRVGGAPTQRSKVSLPVRVRLVQPPPRQKRLLWDMFHSIPYPAGYFPRDDLNQNDDPLDWAGDHPHTNFRQAFAHLRSQGYFIDTLGEPFTCFDARNYGALIVIDSEEEFFDDEIAKLVKDVNEEGLGLIVMADWCVSCTFGSVNISTAHLPTHVQPSS
jgi:membrane-bound transcription factor site-1 protease